VRRGTTDRPVAVVQQLAGRGEWVSALEHHPAWWRHPLGAGPGIARLTKDARRFLANAHVLIGEFGRSK